MKYRFTAFTFLCALLAIPAAYAQPQIFMSTGSSMNGDTATVKFSSPRPIAPQAVTGAPFSGDRVSEHTQTLADGTHIRQPQNVEHISRDSQGRTRSERSAMRGMMAGQAMADFRVTEIVDQVAGFAYILDDQNKIAHRVVLEARPQKMLMVRQSNSTGVGGGVVGSASVGAVRRTQTDDPNRPQTNFEKLESRNIEGVIAQGTRTTSTIPVNAQGNDRPMVQTTESWFSNELKESVLTTNNDPRNGESITKLINISRAEPDPSLFLPPSGYTVVDDKDSVTITFKRPQVQ